MNDDKTAIPTEVGESGEYAGHRIELRDPDGSLTKRFVCLDCGMWHTSARNYVFEECDENES